MPLFRLGTINHAKGYVLNKLFKRHLAGEKHLPLGFLEEGYPPKHRHLIKDAIDSLKHEGLILVQNKRTQRSTGPHACLVASRIPGCRALINAYRRSEDLGAVGRDMKTILPL